MEKVLVVHYGEIGIKGKNRVFFERKLVNNISRVLNEVIGTSDVSREFGRIVCRNVDEKERIVERMELLPGVEYFSFAVTADLDIEDIKMTSLEVLKRRSFERFKVATQRSNKEFEYTSLEVNRIVGGFVKERLEKEVDLSNPDLTLFIEIGDRRAYIYTEKYRGIGGLPVTSSGEVLCLLSGGIDSPVAAFLMMKRGCHVTFLHFYNEIITSRGQLSKIRKIVKALTRIQLSSKLITVPFGELQYEIIRNIPSSYRMVVYRRYMVKLANHIAKKMDIPVIVTGDSIGQVASQTLENLKSIYSASEIPVLSPLIGMNKEEIVKIAKVIGTYQYSILPYQDCCSFMVAPHPATKTKEEEIIKLEKLIENEEEKIGNILRKIEIVEF